MSNSRCASITSRPLLTRVAELIVTSGPIDQVGWASACSGRDVVQLVAAAAAERPAAGGEHQAAHLVGGAAAQALRQRAVLGVDRDDLARLGPRGHDRAADDQRLLVGQRQGAAGVERGERRPQPERTVDAVEHHVARASPRPPPRRPRPARRTAGRNSSTWASNRSGRLPPAVSPTTRNRSGLARHHVERLGADRAGRAEHHDVAPRAARSTRSGRRWRTAPPHRRSRDTPGVDRREFGTKVASSALPFPYRHARPGGARWASPPSGRASRCPRCAMSLATAAGVRRRLLLLLRPSGHPADVPRRRGRVQPAHRANYRTLPPRVALDDLHPASTPRTGSATTPATGHEKAIDLGWWVL